MQTVKARNGGFIHVAYPPGGALCRYLQSAVETRGKLPTCPRCIGIWNGTQPPVRGRDPRAIRVTPSRQEA